MLISAASVGRTIARYVSRASRGFRTLRVTIYSVELGGELVFQ